MLKNNLEALNQRPETGTQKKETVSQGLVTAYQKFAEHFSFEPKLIYYPSSSFDASPSVAFPESRVIYVEIDPEAVEVLKRNNREAIEASALTHILEQKADLLILLNPAIAAKLPIRQVRQGGYVLCNNWHNSATEISHNSEFNLVGIILTGKLSTDEAIVDEMGAKELWNQGVGTKNVDNLYVFQRVMADPKTDEEALAEYRDELEKQRLMAEEALSQYKNVSIDLDDI